jgi:hypoxanthine phosphoribosyltransferase
VRHAPELVCDITGIRINFTKYLIYLKHALSNIDPAIFATAKKIYILPLLRKKDYGKGNKSGYFMLRFFSISDIRTLEIFSGKKIIPLHKPIQTEDDLTGLPKNFNDKDAILLLVDDFIGSGETADGSLKYLLHDLNLSPDKVIIVTLIAQREGYQRIQQQYHTRIYCCEIRNKGISDTYISPKREKYTSLMNEIEDMLQVKDDYRFGYKRSEALVSLMKTPNNTFPVYWEQKEFDDGRKYIGAFPIS